MKNKRIFGLAVALLLSMVVTGGLFAQITFGGVFNTGLGVLGSNDGEQHTVLKAWARDAGQSGYRFRLDGSYQNQDATAGFKVRLQSQNRTDIQGAFAFPYAYGWTKFLNNIFEVRGGILNDDIRLWGMYKWSETVTSGLGGALFIRPVDGLTLGLGAIVMNMQSGGNNNVTAYTRPPVPPATTTNVPNGENFGLASPRVGDVKFTYMAEYILPDVFRFDAAFRWKNKAGTRPVNTDPSGHYNAYDYRSESAYLQGEIELLAMKNLVAILGFTFDPIEEFETLGNIQVSEKFEYKMGDINVGLNMAQMIFNRKIKSPGYSAIDTFVGFNGDTYGADDIDVSDPDAKLKMKPSLFFNLWGSYAIGKIVPRLDLNFNYSARSNLAAKQVDRLGEWTWNNPSWGLNSYTEVEVPKDIDLLFTVFSVRPSVKFNIDSRTSIEIGDLIAFDMANQDGWYQDLNGPDKSMRISNVFYIDLKWSF